MDRLMAMRVFIRVVEAGSFSKAAHEFAITQPTVTKMVASTEERLKVRLLNRNTRGVSATEAGAFYFEKCKYIVREVDEAENIAWLGQTEVHGVLRIGTSVAFGRRVVVPLALEFMEKHPQVQVDLVFDDRYSDLVAQGIDVAIRMGRLADSGMGARLLGSNPWVMAVSARYLKRYGAPLIPEDVGRLNALVYSSVQGNDVWRMQSPTGKTIIVPVTGNWRSNNLSAILAATQAGMGIAALPWYVAANAIASGQLVEVLHEYKLPEQAIHAVFPSPKLIPSKVQVFVSFLKGRFAGRWWERVSNT